MVVSYFFCDNNNWSNSLLSFEVRYKMSWRDKPITDKQMNLIECIMEFSYFDPPKFIGTTRDEASDYIDKYAKLAFEDPTIDDNAGDKV